MRTSCPRSDSPLYVASSLPATISRTSSVLTYVGSWPCLRIAARSAFVDQYDGFFEITPIFMGRRRERAEPLDAVRGRKTCREDEAVKDISADGYRPEEGSRRVHPVASDRRRNVARTTIGVVEEDMILGMDVLRDSGFLVDPSKGNGRDADARGSRHP